MCHTGFRFDHLLVELHSARVADPVGELHEDLVRAGRDLRAVDALDLDRPEARAPGTQDDRDDRLRLGDGRGELVLGVHLPGVLGRDRDCLRVSLADVGGDRADRVPRDLGPLPVVVVVLERVVLLAVGRDLRLEAPLRVLRIERRVDPERPVAVLPLLPDLDAAHRRTWEGEGFPRRSASWNQPGSIRELLCMKDSKPESSRYVVAQSSRERTDRPYDWTILSAVSQENHA